MDLAYLRQHPQHLSTFLTHQRIRETPVPGGSICRASRLTLDDGSSVFAKAWPEPTGGEWTRPGPREEGPTVSSAPTGTPNEDRAAASSSRATNESRDGRGGAPMGFFAAEAAGLDWLAEADAVPVPEVIAALPDLLALEWINPGTPDPAAAHRLGRGLAALHRAGADSFGAPWPGYIGTLPLPNEPSPGPWPRWFASARLEPFLRISAERGALGGDDVAAVEKVLADIERYAGPAADEPPARIHGDLWPGNLLWSASGEAYLVDPAAHGGHRETDLASLALFGGAPHLDRILAGYEEVSPLAPGWRQRVPLHQLHLLLVHTAAFGSAYRPAVMSAVRATVGQ